MLQEYSKVDTSIAYRLFYPNITVIITASLNGYDDAIPAISCTSLSFNPPLFGVAIYPKHYIHRLMTQSKCFAINFLDISSAKSAAICGDISARFSKDKIKISGLELLDTNRTAKSIRGADAVIECSVVDIIKTGDHDFFIGRCDEAYATNDFQKYWKFDEYNPMLYAGSIRRDESKHRFASISRRFTDVRYMQDESKNQILNRVHDIMNKEVKTKQLSINDAVRIVSNRLSIDELDSRYVIELLEKEGRISL